MTHYAIALNSDRSCAGTSTLSPDGVAMLFRLVNGYSMSWYVGTDHIWHGGANETFRTSVELHSSRNLGIVLLINQGYMLDHYIFGPQLPAGVQDIVLGGSLPVVGAGLSVRAR